MLAYIVRRILLAGLTLSLMSVLTFVVMQLPEGDYSRQVADQHGNSTASTSRRQCSTGSGSPR